jgi:hypothetical protein
MSGNWTRTPIGQSLPRIAQEAVEKALEQLGKGLPCRVVSVNGQFVTVSFDVKGGIYNLPNVTIPINTSVYDYLPIQPGDEGYTQAADVSVAGVSGVSSGSPNLVQGGNLSNLVFQPISNKGWMNHGNMRVTQGPGGVLVQDMGASTTFLLTPGNITMTAGGHTVAISSAGVVIDGIVFGTHQHTLVTPGPGDSGPPL